MAKPTFRTFSLFIISLLFFVAITNDVKAQEEFEKWKENYLNEFQEFQNKYDKEFHEMLKKEWKKFDTESSPDFYQKPKPKVVPKVEKPKPPEPKAEVELEETKEPEKEVEQNDLQWLDAFLGFFREKAQDSQPDESKQSPKKKKEDREENVLTSKNDKKTATSITEGLTPSFEPKVKKAKVQTDNLDYFGIPIQYKYYAAYKTRADRPVDQKVISDFWKHLSTKDYPSFLKQIDEVRSKLSLNDYGYAQLLEDIGNQIYGDGTHEATLFTWFMLTQSGFGTRIAYNNQSVYLLIRTNPGVFRTTYFTINGSKYYGLSFDESYSQLPDQLYTYEGDYPKSKEKELDLLFAKLPTLPEKPENRTLSFSYGDTSYTFEVPVDLQIINYFKKYPKADLSLYFNSQMDGETHEVLISSLRPLLKGKSDVEKANLLLRFVQKSFDYQTDQEQFNTEKKMFPAEAIYYPASDCDDRSILFAYLVENLTDLQYIVLRYPSHLTPAIHFPSNPPNGSEVGNPVVYKGKPYYVTDPTYIGADVGMVMTKYQGSRPEEIFDL